MNHSEINIYKAPDGKTEIDVTLDHETVWLNLMQLTALFQRDKSVISRHINNIFKEEELDIEATVAKFATVQLEGDREVERSIEFYNLDVIISIGYRIKSQRGTQFRIWANSILKDYLIKGYSMNEKRLLQENEQLREFQESVKILGNVLKYKSLTGDESSGLLKIISDYAYALDILDQYDYQNLEITNTSGKEIYQVSYEEAMLQIRKTKEIYGNMAIKELQPFCSCTSSRKMQFCLTSLETNESPTTPWLPSL